MDQGKACSNECMIELNFCRFTSESQSLHRNGNFRACMIRLMHHTHIYLYMYSGRDRYIERNYWRYCIHIDMYLCIINIYAYIYRVEAIAPVYV